uniref:Disintegrin and metalloproteinase domain-containing protein 8 n=1 Tax=Dicentrarchus labrax TaxID=13489 RepID=E6ZI48_DICLA|nr:Disintegrin and metalloproteinase domain-containing protein 8 [Dicentrarchus labrax]
MGANQVSVWLMWVCLVQCSGMLSHVERYEVVRPQRLAGRLKRSLRDNQLYPDTVRYELAVEGKKHTIHLEKNRNLFGKGYTETHYSEDGKRVTTSPNEIERTDSSLIDRVSTQEHCYYHGHIEGMKDSSVSVGICSGVRQFIVDKTIPIYKSNHIYEHIQFALSGFVRARQQLYLIEPLGQSEDDDHAVYRQEHLKFNSRPGSSSNTTISYDRDQDQPSTRRTLQKSKTITGPQKFVELFVVVDNAEYNRYGSQTKSRILGVINHVDKLYRSLNIRVMLVGLEIWTYEDHFNVHLNSETALDNFLLWRQASLLPKTKHDNAQFVTGKDFDGDTVGLANKFAMCSENSGGVNQVRVTSSTNPTNGRRWKDHHDNPIGLASTIAHEMGHNFGLSHDATGCVCGPSYSGNCVMADKLRTGTQAFPEFFSDCSIEQLAEFMERAQPSCLSKPSSVKTIAIAPAAATPCWTPERSVTVALWRNPCCDASTCRLTEGSQCAHGQCCDNCQVTAAGSVCRKAASGCDLPEYCTGVSEDCPEDSFEMNGKPCYNQAQGYCYNGRCPTHEQQCWRLFGPGTRVGSDVCFNLNKRGEKGANCGKTQSNYAPCTESNLKCGSIFCGGGGESITGKRASYTVYGIECKLAEDDDKTRNMDMVPKGTKCGPNKVCFDNRCVDLSVYGKTEDCAKKCNNNGVCNHKNECHCNPGWAPPYCDIQYADLPQGQNGIIAGVCAVLSILLVITVVIASLMCCKKDNMDNYTSKRYLSAFSHIYYAALSSVCRLSSISQLNKCRVRRKVHSAPDRLNPMFQEPNGKDRPQISQPTFMESTAAQACAPLIVTVTPSRPAPQPPKKLSSVASTSQTEPMKPQPPVKPLPPLNKTQYKAASPSVPPVPPVKPSPPPAARIKPCAPPPLPPAKPHVHRLA